MKKTTKKFASVALAGALAFGAAGCTSANDELGKSGGGSGGGKTIRIGYIDWDEDVAVTHLWKKVLEKKGYNVQLQHVTDAGPVFVGLDKGQIDLYMDGWLPLTHADYWNKYKNNLQDLGSWYDNAKLTIAVPKYMTDVNSIADLPKVANKVNGKIVGIEAGAGLTKATKKAIPAYGLSMYQLQTSSTPAMLAALKKATDAKKPVVVTLWRPHWAYAAFPIKDLQDPKGEMGKAEHIHAIGKKDFGSKYPDVEKMVKKFKMTDPQLSKLEQYVLQDNKDNPEKGVDQWLKENPDFEKQLG